MRALAKFTTGILRVESPPLSRVEISRPPNSRDATFKLRVRFAFDVIRVVNNGGRTVRLELKKSSNPQIAAAAKDSSPSFSTITSVESIHVKSVESITIAVHEFDVMKSIPDEAISSLKSGNPIEYLYLLAVPAALKRAARVNARVSDRDYLLKNLEAGIDPATLSETFPVKDSSKKSQPGATASNSFYTRPVSTSSDYQKMKAYSAYQIFEQDIEISAQDFLSASIYEFSYVDYAGTPIEFAEVRVQSSAIYEEMKKLQYTSLSGLVSENSFESSGPQVIEYVRNIVSNSSLVSTEFAVKTGSSYSNNPKIVRTHYNLPGSERQSIKFQSRVDGLPSFRSKVTSNSNSTKSSVIPFYIDNSRKSLCVVIKRLPPQATRVAVRIRNVTKGEDSFIELTSQRVIRETLNEVYVTLPESDCTYEFRVTSTDRKQRTVTSCNSLVYSEITPYRNATLNVSRPSLIGDQRVKFKISADFTEAGRKDLTELIKIVNSSGVSTTTLSAEGYISNPDLYSEIFSCRVEKINLENGEQTYTKEFAVGPGPVDFVDTVANAAGAAYVFSLGMRSPASLIPQQRFYKFGTFGGRYLASLPSKASTFSDARSGASFEKIDSGIKRVVEVPTTTLRGRVVLTGLSSTMRDSTLIEWNYLGDITEVDHFQVFGSADGVECLLGCSFRGYAYEDTVLHNRVGVVTYRVRPIYVSLEPGVAVSISSYKKSTIPDILLPIFSNGQQQTKNVTAFNSSITVETLESYTQQYTDYLSSEISKRERASTSTQERSSLKRFQTSSGLASVKINKRSSPGIKFDSSPIVESQQVISPINSFTLEAIVEGQFSPETSNQSQQTFLANSISAEKSVRSNSVTEIEPQQVAYRRNMR